MFSLFSRKQKLKKEREALRLEIEAKQAEVEEADRQCRVAWGKKWAYIQMQRKRLGMAGDGELPPEKIDGQAEVLEMRRQGFLAELKARERELGELLEKDRQLAKELGEEPIVQPEVDSEDH